MIGNAKPVLCYGVIAVDQIVRPEEFPEPDGHTKMISDDEFPGGEATNVALTLAGLGVRTRLMGTTLGDDRRGRWLLKRMGESPVDTVGLNVDPGIRTTHALILSASDHTRSIMGFFPDLACVPLQSIDLDDVSMLSVDPFLGEPAVEAAQMAKARNVPVFSIEITEQHPLSEYCQVVILSRGFLRRHQMGDPEDVAVGLLKSGVKYVMVTSGENGVSVFREDGTSFHQPAYPVPVVDTTGAGDAFRSGLMYGYLRGWTLTRSVQFAAGAASLTCRNIGGGGHVRGEGQVMQLIGNA